MKRKLPKNFNIFSKESLSYILGNGNPEKKIPYTSGKGTFLYFIFQEVTFRARKVKKNPLIKSFLYFEKWNFLAPGLKNFL